MPSRYHPIEDGLWDDPKFDATEMVGEAPGEERGFFCFLTSNKMQRPAGLYRATIEEIAAAGRYPEKRVKFYLDDLEKRDLIVRDGSWIFLPGYWKRQAHNPGMLKAAKKSVVSCSSAKVLDSFFQHYPIYKQWFPNGWQTVTEPKIKIDATEQSRAEHIKDSRTLNGCGTVKEPLKKERSPTPGVKVLIDFWYQTYRQVFGSVPPVNGGKCGATAKKLLAGRTVDEAKLLVEEHLRNPPELYRDKNLYGLEHVLSAATTILARPRFQRLKKEQLHGPETQ